MVITPDISNLPYKEIKGVKYFELVAEKVERELLPGLFIKAWGYNGSTPGPTIQVYPGDYVNFRVYNKLTEPTSIHWHGLDVPNVMDGVPDVEPSPKIEELPMGIVKPGKYDINPDIWPFHCHLPHHVSNNMTDPTGGMFTTINYVSN